jgi:hypothetical protein
MSSSDRRRFLQHLSLGGFALGATPSLLTAAESGEGARAAAEATPCIGERPRDFAAASQSSQPPFDITWVQRLTGKYRAVFDVPELTEGSGVFRAGLWRVHYREMLQAAPEDLSTVIVIRHEAMPFIMSHEFWDRYNVAEEHKLTHPLTEQPTRRNIVNMTAEADGLPAAFAGYSLDQQIAAGAIVLGCNMAFSAMTALVRKHDNVPNAEAREQALSMMLPGVQLQPNGIFAVTMAQQHGCVFVAAS